ncbi:MAG: hypothetical protein ACFFDF_15960 [Candidatus Odinarchaeota archaeon]
MSYLNERHLSLSDLADAYLEISRTIYSILLIYHKKWWNLKKRFISILELMDNIQKKGTKPSPVVGEDQESRPRVDVNKNQTLRNIEFYTSIMQKLIERRFYYIFSIVALAISIISLVFSIF